MTETTEDGQTKMQTPEERLTERERSYLELAREHTREVYALEHYSHLWNELDRRLGADNDLTGQFVREYQGRAFERPRDGYESRRVDLMRASFVFQRIGMPEDLRRVLLLSSVFRR